MPNTVKPLLEYSLAELTAELDTRFDRQRTEDMLNATVPKPVGLNTVDNILYAIWLKSSDMMKSGRIEIDDLSVEAKGTMAKLRDVMHDARKSPLPYDRCRFDLVVALDNFFKSMGW